jgi:hypothetical protein
MDRRRRLDVKQAAQVLGVSTDAVEGPLRTITTPSEYQTHVRNIHPQDTPSDYGPSPKGAAKAEGEIPFLVLCSRRWLLG